MGIFKRKKEENENVKNISGSAFLAAKTAVRIVTLDKEKFPIITSTNTLIAEAAIYITMRMSFWLKIVIQDRALASKFIQQYSWYIIYLMRTSYGIEIPEDILSIRIEYHGKASLDSNRYDDDMTNEILAFSAIVSKEIYKDEFIKDIDDVLSILPSIDKAIITECDNLLPAVLEAITRHTEVICRDMNRTGEIGAYTVRCQQ